MKTFTKFAALTVALTLAVVAVVACNAVGGPVLAGVVGATLLVGFANR